MPSYAPYMCCMYHGAVSAAPPVGGGGGIHPRLQTYLTQVAPTAGEVAAVSALHAELTANFENNIIACFPFTGDSMAKFCVNMFEPAPYAQNRYGANFGSNQQMGFNGLLLMEDSTNAFYTWVNPYLNFTPDRTVDKFGVSINTQNNAPYISILNEIIADEPQTFEDLNYNPNEGAVTWCSLTGNNNLSLPAELLEPGTFTIRRTTTGTINVKRFGASNAFITPSDAVISAPAHGGHVVILGSDYKPYDVSCLVVHRNLNTDQVDTLNQIVENFAVAKFL